MSIRFEYTKRLPDSFWGHVSTVALINEGLGRRHSESHGPTTPSIPDEFLEQILRRFAREAIAEALLIELPAREQNVPALMHAALRARLNVILSDSRSAGLLNESLDELQAGEARGVLSDILRAELTDGEKDLAFWLSKRSERPRLTEQDGLILELAAAISKLWPKDQRVLTVYFFTESDSYHAKVLGIANEWNKHCGIRFEKTIDKDKAHLRVAFQPDFSYSYVGTDAQHPSVPKAAETLNLGWLTRELDKDEDQHLILHEFGHALGLVHEHAREDANMEWNEEEVRKAFPGKDDTWLRVNVYDEFKRHETNHSRIVDPYSIMCYPIEPRFTKSGRVFFRSSKLSDTDKQHIGHIYPKRQDVLHS